MNATVDVLEEELREIWRQQAVRYEAALGVSRRLAEKFLEGEDTYEPLQQLNAILDEMATLNQRSAELQPRWASARRRPSGELTAAWARLEAAMRQLIDTLDQAEACARDARQRLLPELGREAVAKHMQRAYTASARGEAP
jgi:hypothetical protein